MNTTRKYITKQGKSKMISLTIGISRELQLKVTNIQNSLRCGGITFYSTANEIENVMVNQCDVRATANAFVFLADMLDAEAKND